MQPSYYKSLTTAQLWSEKQDDVFLLTTERRTIDDVVTLLDSKLIDPKSAAARFLALSLALDPDTTDEEIYAALTEYNWHPELVAVVAELGKTVIIEPTRNCKKKFYDFEKDLCLAAREGRTEAMNSAKDAGAIDFESAFFCAASEGELEAMKLLKTWGATWYDRAFAAAAENGQVYAMELLKFWGARDYDWALRAANARKSRSSVTKLLKNWILKKWDF